MQMEMQVLGKHSKATPRKAKANKIKERRGKVKQAKQHDSKQRKANQGNDKANKSELEQRKPACSTWCDLKLDVNVDRGAIYTLMMMQA